MSFYKLDSIKDSPYPESDNMKDIQLTPGQMLTYARHQLKRCEREADSWRKVVEGLVGAGASGDDDAEGKNGSTALPTLGTITADKLRFVLASKAMRVKDIAERFQVRPRDIEDILDRTDSGLIRGERGWIKLKSENKKANE